MIWAGESKGILAPWTAVANKHSAVVIAFMLSDESLQKRPDRLERLKLIDGTISKAGRGLEVGDSLWN